LYPEGRGAGESRRSHLDRLLAEDLKGERSMLVHVPELIQDPQFLFAEGIASVMRLKERCMIARSTIASSSATEGEGLPLSCMGKTPFLCQAGGRSRGAPGHLFVVPQEARVARGPILLLQRRDMRDASHRVKLLDGGWRSDESYSSPRDLATSPVGPLSNSKL
jgi:hypothetical protein